MLFDLSRIFGRRFDPGKPARRAGDIGNVISAIMADQGLGSDFERVADLRWVHEQRDQIRHIFEFKAMKGATYSACWGVSLDFVPVAHRGRLAWKRTSKSARMDLCIDPIDEKGSASTWCSLFDNDDDRRIGKVVRASLRAADVDLAKLNSLQGVLAAFEQRAAMQSGRFSLENYVQTDLAWGLLLIALAREEEGIRLLDGYCERFGVSRDDMVLAKAMAAARDIAKN